MWGETAIAHSELPDRSEGVLASCMLDDDDGNDCTADCGGVWGGAAENDGYNTLVLKAALDWRQAAMLRTWVAI